MTLISTFSPHRPPAIPLRKPLSLITFTASPPLPHTASPMASPSVADPLAMEPLRHRRRIDTLPPTAAPRLAPRPPLPHRPIKVIRQSALDDADSPKPPSLLSGARGPLLGVLIHLLTATVFLKISEGWALLDALYFAVVIATTVGYGDITPTRTVSKLFVSLYAIISVALIAGMLQSLVDRVADTQRTVANRAHRALLLRAAPPPSDDTVADSIISSPRADDIIHTTNIAAKRARLRLRATVIMVLVTCVSGVFIYGRFLKASYIDLIYFLCVSMTTVGLGDIHPVTRVGKAYAAVWLVLTSLGFANILSQYANLRVKERERDVAKRILSGKVGEEMFHEIDDDGDGTLSEAEFLGYMLCKLGKATPEEVSFTIKSCYLYLSYSLSIYYTLRSHRDLFLLSNCSCHC